MEYPNLTLGKQFWIFIYEGLDNFNKLVEKNDELNSKTKF